MIYQKCVYQSGYFTNERAISIFGFRFLRTVFVYQSGHCTDERPIFILAIFPANLAIRVLKIPFSNSVSLVKSSRFNSLIRRFAIIFENFEIKNVLLSFLIITFSA